MNILIIEDDIYLAQKIADTFTDNISSNRVKIIHSYQEFIHEFPCMQQYDICIADIMLENKKASLGGLDILKKIRQKGYTIPVVMVSSESSCDSLRYAFNIGANDYIIKPFRLRELEIRTIRWFHNYLFSEYYSFHEKIEYGKLEYNISKNIFYYERKEIFLSRGEKYLLILFLINKEKLLSQDFLIEKIWGESDFIKRNPRVNVLRLKNKLKTCGIDFWIHTDGGGGGYVFRNT